MILYLYSSIRLFGLGHGRTTWRAETDAAGKHQNESDADDAESNEINVLRHKADPCLAGMCLWQALPRYPELILRKRTTPRTVDELSHVCKNFLCKVCAVRDEAVATKRNNLSHGLCIIYHPIMYLSSNVMGKVD